MDIRAVKFRVGHGWRVGGLYQPSRPAPTPAVLLLHGFPGVQRNEDLAAELCRRGMTVFLPHFRGCWGSGGAFSVRGLLEDARADLRLLRRYRHVDAARVGLLGYSLGGWVALKLAAETPVAAVAALAPAIPRADPGEAEARYLRRSGRVVNIPSKAAVWDEYVSLARTEPVEGFARKLAPAPLLLVQGLRDRLVPPETARRVFAAAAEPKRLLELPEEDHELQRDRPALVSAVCGWLQARLEAGARQRVEAL